MKVDLGKVLILMVFQRSALVSERIFRSVGDGRQNPVHSTYAVFLLEVRAMTNANNLNSHCYRCVYITF